MKRTSKIALVLLTAFVLFMLDWSWTDSNTFYNASFPTSEETSFLTPANSQEIKVIFENEQGTSLDYLIEMGDAVEPAYRSMIAEKVYTIVQNSLRVAGLGDDAVNIYTSEKGDDYALTLEVANSENISKVKELVPNSLTFENGWWSWLKSKKIQLGLDLQGGAQLDYRVDLSRVATEDYESVIEGNLAVVERRVNALGVSEPNIYVSQVGDEYHIVVELAGVLDLDEAKATIGKTVQLEFKEPRADDDNSSLEEIRSKASKALFKINSNPDDFRKIALEQQGENYDDGVRFSETEYQFLDEVSSSKLADALKEMKVGEVAPMIDDVYSYTYDQSTGNIEPINAFYLAKLVGEDTAEHEVEVTPAGEEEVEASHILVMYDGATNADPEITRTKEEAKMRAEEALAKALAGEDFAGLAKEYSDGPTAEYGGELGSFTRGKMVKEFEDAAFATPAGEYAPITETEFGFHVIKVTNRKEATEAVTEMQNDRRVKLQTLVFPQEVEPWVSTELDGSHFKHASVQLDPKTFAPYVSITFDDEGATLFGDLTEKLIKKQLAIFVGGELISAPRVNEKIGTGQAQITGSFTLEEATQLANDLNSGAIPAPLEEPSQLVVSPMLGADALATSIYAGMLGLLIVVIYMTLYYRLPGLIAGIALCFYAGILIFILKFAGVFVLTLAGVAGIILSIGMAVDANVLIFERLKEEMQSGKNLSTAIAVGFERAWSSIRDANVSTLITCVILYWFGTSIIRGFALTLALGVVLSMLTAIIITRGILKIFVGTRIGRTRWLFGDNKNK